MNVRRNSFVRATAARGSVLLTVIAAVQWPEPVAAYRPFDGTDAAVADVKEVEVELAPIGRLQDSSQKNIVAPAVIYNYGFAERWEMVVQGQAEVPYDPLGLTTVIETGVFLKHVIRPGVLQDQPGMSIATEFGVLPPGVNTDRGFGASWAVIVSQRWDWATVHWNVGTSLTRDQRGEAFLDVIVEGPSKWKIRPVLEIFSDSVYGQAQTYSSLVGAIWQVRDNLAFDVGVRYALVNNRPVNEFRAGVTFAFKVDGSEPPAD